MNMIIAFPNKFALHPTTSYATNLDILLGRIRELFCNLLYKNNVPAFISNCEINDQLTGQSIVITSGKLTTKITINGRDYFFDRITGQFTGTGLGCS